jgi:hypothetical protein
MLSKSLPQLISLWTSGVNLHLDENLAKLIILIVTHFEDLVEVIINKNSRYRNEREGFNMLFSEQKCIENILRNSTKLCDPNRTNIFWTYYPELRIWL